ncbi:MAG: response regulator [Cyanobacteria bacterium J06642_11]
MTFLLVEDDLLLAKGTAKLIEKLSGTEVITSSDPEEIVSLCCAGKVDLVIMDVNLPGAKLNGKNVSGADLSKHLKTVQATSHIPIVLLTAYAMEYERESLMAVSKADGFWAKPITDYDKFISSLTELSTQRSQSL